MKILLATTPIRPTPSIFPPFGSLSLINYLRKNSFDVDHELEFYNIDATRPRYADALAHVLAAKPDILAISAVVSTAYAYTRRLARDVKAALPDTLVVVGGNLAASAEILLRKAGVDICVLGEGEKIFLNLVNRAKATRNLDEYADIPGLAFLSSDGKMVNTGFEMPLAKEEIYDIDWRDLEKAADIGIFIYRVLDDNGRVLLPPFRNDPRVQEPHRRRKKFAILPDSKGCVSRCTFCHRWDKGIRYIPVDIVMKRLDWLIERYDIGFLEPDMENFGNDKRWLEDFCAEIKKRDILWTIKSMRTRSVTKDWIDRMKNAGCVGINYGIESGSQPILDVMEKKATVDDNRLAHRWTVEAGLNTVIALVLGMPGESPATIKDNIAFLQEAVTLDPAFNPNNLSINYAQALPGTPLYEFGRRRGLVAPGLDGEEQYLLSISDRDAHDETATLNFTDYPTLETQCWRPWITIEVNYAFIVRFGMEQYRKVLLSGSSSDDTDDGYHANPKRLPKDAALPGLATLLSQRRFGEAMIHHPALFHRLRRLLPLMVLLKGFGRHGLGRSLRMLADYVFWRLAPTRWAGQQAFSYKSLRKIVWEDETPLPGDTPASLSLRKGR